MWFLLYYLRSGVFLIIVFKGWLLFVPSWIVCGVFSCIKTIFFSVFPLIYYSDWYFRVLLSLLTLMLFLRRIHPPNFCFSSTFCTRVRCRNLSAQRKWWMSSVPGIIHWVTNHGIFCSVFCMCSKHTTLGAIKKHFLSLEQSSLSTEIVCLADSYCFKGVNTIKCNSPPLENRLIYLALTRAWSVFYLFPFPRFCFCHGEVCYSWFKWMYNLFQKELMCYSNLH